MDAHSATQVFSVPTMHCSSCAMLLEGLEDKLEGIKAVRADYRKRRMVVEYDPRCVTPEAIAAAAKREGYDAIPDNAPRKQYPLLS